MLSTRDDRRLRHGMVPCAADILQPSTNAAVRERTESLQSLARPPLPVLTGLRFLAAFIVLVAHASHSVVQFTDATFWRTLGNVIVWVGMSLFFVLSGFVVHYNYGHLFARADFRAALHAFASARAARILPLYFFIFLVAITTIYPLQVGTFKSCPNNGFRLFFFLTATQSWLPVMMDHDHTWMVTSMFPHAWSISTEIFFYFMYPLLALAILRAERPARIAATVGAFVTASFACLWGLYESRTSWAPSVFGAFADSPNVDQFMCWLAYFSPWVRILEFILGCLTAHLFLSLRERTPSALEARFGRVVLWTAICAILALHVVWPPPGSGMHLFFNVSFLYAPLIAVVLLCSCRYPSLFSRVFSSAWLVALGEVSYSTYLLHGFILGMFHYSGDMRFSTSLLIEWVLRMIVSVALTLILSFGTYQFIEVPGRRWLRMVLGRGSQTGQGERPGVGLLALIGLIPCLGLFAGMLSFWCWQPSSVHYDRGISREQKQEYATALREYDRALERRDSHAEAYYHRGLVKRATDNHRGAIDDFDQAIKLRPDWGEAYLGRGLVRQSIGDHQAAIADIDQAIALDATLAVAAAAARAACVAAGNTP